MASFQDVDPELAAFRSKFGGPMMGLDQPGGILTGTPQAVSDFKGAIHPALARFLERRPERVLIEQGAQMRRPSEHGLTATLLGIRQRLGLGGRGAERAAQDLESIGLTPQTMPDAEYLIRLRRRAHSTAASHEGIHTALHMTKGSPYTPSKYDPLLAPHAPRFIQPSIGESIIQWMAENSNPVGGFHGLY